MDLFNSSEFSSHVEKLIKQYHTPGLAIAVVQNEAVASAGYGNASLDPIKPCTADTLFDIASASKSLTAASVALLVDDEQKYPEVQYEAIMSSLLPDDFVMPGTGYTENVTVEDILSHRTGMPGHDFSYMSPRAARPDDTRSTTRNLRNLPVCAPIRTKVMYCNMMYTVAAYLVEKKSGISFSDFLQKHFSQPLGMHTTNLQPERARAKGLGDRIATGYSWNEQIEEYKGFQTPDCPETEGAGCIMTSVNDYIKWVKAMMNHEYPITADIYNGLIRSRSIQNPSAENLMPLTSPAMFAAGWEIFFYRGHMVVNHDGAVPGFSSRHFFLPNFKFGGVIFGNSEGAESVAAILSLELIDEVFKVPEAERLDWNKIESDRIDYERSNDEEELKKLYPDVDEPRLQETPLSVYTGEYSNPGYHSMIVQIRDNKLFIDATERSMGFTLVFDHICDQTKYIAHMSDYLEGGDDILKAEFEFGGGKAIRMGIHLDYQMEELIWFDKAQ